MPQERIHTPSMPIILVNTNQSLWKLTPKLKKQGILAVDTEYDSFYRYRPRLCLIQIGSSEAIYLVDLITISNVDPLKEILENPLIEKIFHDSRQDLLLLKKTLQINPTNIFDTAIAARVLGRFQIGLKKLLFELLNITISKKGSRTDWSKRPLTEKMKEYAANDVRFLRELRDYLLEELNEARRYQEAKELFEWIAQLQPKERIFNPNSFLSLPKARELPFEVLPLLKALFLWRENKAWQTNRPVFMIMPNEFLVDLADQNPRTENELKGILSKHPKLAERYSVELQIVLRDTKNAEPIDTTEIKITKKWIDSPELFAQNTPRMPQNKITRYRNLLEWRKKIAEQREVDSEVVIPKEIIQEMSEENPQTIKELHERPGFGTWRKQQYGAEIIAISRKANRQLSCFLCEREFSKREINTSCPFCNIRFHIEEILEYLSETSHCPNCNETLDV